MNEIEKNDMTKHGLALHGVDTRTSGALKVSGFLPEIRDVQCAATHQPSFTTKHPIKATNDCSGMSGIGFHFASPATMDRRNGMNAKRYHQNQTSETKHQTNM